MQKEPSTSAIVIGASGGIGAALADELERRGQPVRRLGRRTTPALDLLDEASIARAAAETGPGLRLVLDATGFLHDGHFQPEKSFRQLDPAHMARSFALNATGPALLMKHFLPLLARDGRAVFATLSARVGSIADNRLGGWTSYRAAKAALNQITRTCAIELARTRPQAICVALHPGTVDTSLSAPFAKAGLEVQPAVLAAGRLLDVVAALTPADNGGFFDHHGRPIPF
ncbi:SDR family NAD(P)-dependent oxidoreductase [Roseococcus sp. SDR]|uniref:SDR family NAD(P)-dependent oxidoreductase n=1 Tax=Roseococcus sp. SDR TaxID=2835532 RepID=UPI001BD0ED76|nr:SDR family NAD(P)-dependent oxidoreductase [Roseococcus sp. SDR]MBS7789076.1 SDR family NAD(P)-dependent oxidoreductase [Roseococcus sp. SDR]MBV1844390.1 SDR family NAD(P)-dependent oxidoreductase [Roseococcus sp. SDR]